jgi:siroheme synthase-like protein
MPALYPIYLDLSGSLCVVIGGGRVAERKVEGLLDAGARVRVVSLSFTPELERLGDEGRLEPVRASFDRAYLEQARLVFAATGDRNVNAAIARTAREMGIEVNVADSPEESSIYIPSVVRRGALAVAVSTGGASPGLAAAVAERIGFGLEPEFAGLVELLAGLRGYIREELASIADRRAAFAALVQAEADLRRSIRESGMEAARSRAIQIIAQAARSARSGSERDDCISSSSD